MGWVRESKIIQGYVIEYVTNVINKLDPTGNFRGVLQTCFRIVPKNRGESL